MKVKIFIHEKWVIWFYILKSIDQLIIEEYHGIPGILVESQDLEIIMITFAVNILDFIKTIRNAVSDICVIRWFYVLII